MTSTIEWSTMSFSWGAARDLGAAGGPPLTSVSEDEAAEVAPADGVWERLTAPPRPRRYGRRAGPDPSGTAGPLPAP